MVQLSFVILSPEKKSKFKIPGLVPVDYESSLFYRSIPGSHLKLAFYEDFKIVEVLLLESYFYIVITPPGTARGGLKKKWPKS